MRTAIAVLAACCLSARGAAAQGKIKTLIVDGQNNHAWQQTTPVLKKLLEETGLFAVDVATAPPKGGDMTAFRPAFDGYRVVVSNYNGEPWAAETRSAFEKFVRGGGGFVSYHAANNAFPEWTDYNRMIAIGGWGERNEQSGPYARFRDGKLVIENKPGPGGHHGSRHPFQIAMRDMRHPISQGLPAAWMHAEDELYDSLRGPAQHIRLLATAFSDPATKGTGENEPMLMTIPYEKGRVFHTTLGHDLTAMSCVGFITTLQRGAEWAATGKVSQKVPADFPTAEKVSVRRP